MHRHRTRECLYTESNLEIELTGDEAMIGYSYSVYCDLQQQHKFPTLGCYVQQAKTHEVVVHLGIIAL